MASKLMFPVLLMGILAAATSQPVPGIFYPVAGQRSSRSDDGSSPQIHLHRPFNFFGRTYNQIYVNHNGHLTFNSSFRTYTPQRFPLHGSRDIIAALWIDLDNRDTGQIFYSQYTNGSVVQQATKDINLYFPGLNFTADLVFVATWLEVPYFFDRNATTTIQAVLISGGRRSFVLLNYGTIASTSHDALAGYDTISSAHHFTIPGSFTSQATGNNSVFLRSSNVNLNGRWAFRIDAGPRSCTFSGQLVQLGDSFWSDINCTQKCTCTSTGIRCFNEPCSFSRICQRSSFQFACRTARKGLDCPANSHYELCGTDCGRTCSSSSSNDAACEQVCSEGCFCDEGFARRGTACVPMESCGCLYDGFYYNASESFWTEGCSQRCECHAPNDLRCSAASCTPEQECTIRNGQLGCYDTLATCTVWGDPHYITFDGALAHFQGTCTYIITESVNQGIDETEFLVTATNNHRGNNFVSFVSAVDIRLSNQSERTNIRLGPNNRVMVNGSEVSLPTTAGTLARVYRLGRYMVVNATGLIVQFDGQSTLLVRIGQHLENRVRGMCGNFNNNPADDKVYPNGTLARNDNYFGHSWMAATSQPGCGSTDEEIGDLLNNSSCVEEYSNLCSVITNTSGPFASCHLHADPQPFFTSCVYDLCLYTKPNGTLCSDVAAYEKRCSVLGLNVSDWRSDLQCAESDPCEELNCTHYEWCGEKDGVHGCFCDELHRRRRKETYDLSITCASSSGTISVSRCQLFEAGFHHEALHLREHSCKGSLQDGRLIFHFDNDRWLCGTVLKSNGTHFMYENAIQDDVDLHDRLISRQRSIHLSFSCEYLLTQALSVEMGINPVESLVSKSLLSGVGRYGIRMIPYEDDGYRFPLTSSSKIVMDVDQRFYVEVRAEGLDAQHISTVLDSCWATPINAADNPVRWDLIDAECPNPNDNTVQLVQNGVSTMARFSFMMFTFNNYSSVYLHCLVHLCLLQNNDCSARCFPKSSLRMRREASFHDTSDISLGPLVLRGHGRDFYLRPPRGRRRVVRDNRMTNGALRPLTSAVTLLISFLAVKAVIKRS